MGHSRKFGEQWVGCTGARGADGRAAGRLRSVQATRRVESMQEQVCTCPILPLFIAVHRNLARGVIFWARKSCRPCPFLHSATLVSCSHSRTCPTQAAPYRLDGHECPKPLHEARLLQQRSLPRIHYAAQHARSISCRRSSWATCDPALHGPGLPRPVTHIVRPRTHPLCWAGLLPRPVDRLHRHLGNGAVIVAIQKTPGVAS